MSTYTTIHVPASARHLIEKIIRQARRDGLEVRARGFHEFVLVESALPKGVTRLRPRQVVTGPDVGGAA